MIFFFQNFSRISFVVSQGILLKFLFKIFRNSLRIIVGNFFGAPPGILSEQFREFYRSYNENSFEASPKLIRISSTDSPGISLKFLQQILGFSLEIPRSSSRNSFEDLLGYSPQFIRDFMFLQEFIWSFSSNSLGVPVGIPLKVLQEFFQSSPCFFLSSSWNFFGVSPGILPYLLQDFFGAPLGIPFDFLYSFSCFFFYEFYLEVSQSSSSNSSEILRDYIRIFSAVISQNSMDCHREFFYTFSGNFAKVSPGIHLDYLRKFFQSTSCNSSGAPSGFLLITSRNSSRLPPANLFRFYPAIPWKFV